MHKYAKISLNITSSISTINLIICCFIFPCLSQFAVLQNILCSIVGLQIHSLLPLTLVTFFQIYNLLIKLSRYSHSWRRKATSYHTVANLYESQQEPYLLSLQFIALNTACEAVKRYSMQRQLGSRRNQSLGIVPIQFITMTGVDKNSEDHTLLCS